jgi:hypothetical protein
MMRRLALAMSVLPGLAMADTLSLTEVLQAQRWVMEEARCADVISLFTTPTEVADDVTEDNSARLLFASTLMEGAALERGVSYGTLALDWGAFCAENPESHWLEFL